MGYGSFDYNYSFHYSAMEFENSNMQTITPSFAFDSEYVLVENNDNKLTYPKITIGPANSDVFYALKLTNIFISFYFRFIIISFRFCRYDTKYWTN